jgi:hypothetical protein
MVEIEARITIEIEVENYEQVVKEERGGLLGTVARVPKVNSFVRNKVDRTIRKEVEENLKQALPEKLAGRLTEELREKGVVASVNVSLAYESELPDERDPE